MESVNQQSQAARFADLVERIADRARALTVDRIAKGVTLTALGLGVVLLAVTAVILACIGLFRLLALGVGAPGAYTIFGGLFLAAGWFTWKKRIPEPEEPDG